MTHTIPIVLTIAGSDSSGGAGLQADLKTFSALGAYGASVVTALTAQNTLGVTAIHTVPADFVRAQLDAVLSDLDVRAVKIGMAGSAETISAVADMLADGGIPLVVDPVMVAESGAALLDAQAERIMKEKLLPIADILTPNLHEAARLLGQPLAADETEMRAQARDLHELGPASVLVKGGHAAGAEAVDIFFDGTKYDRLAMPWVDTPNGHGTGCTLASAIAAFLAHGAGIRDAVFRAKPYITDALARSDALDVGAGAGPVHHFHALWKMFGEDTA